jgi:hypothetical protein
MASLPTVTKLYCRSNEMKLKIKTQATKLISNLIMHENNLKVGGFKSILLRGTEREA